MSLVDGFYNYGDMNDANGLLPRAGLNNPIVGNLSEVREDAGIEPFPGKELPAQNAFTALLALRAQFPYMPIMPFPLRTVSALLQAGAARSIPVPSHVVMVRFAGNGDYFVSRAGNAELPAAANEALASDPDGSKSHSVFRPEFAFFYVGGIREFSVISPLDNVTVNVTFYVAGDYPSR